MATAAPFKKGRAPDLVTAASNPAAGLMPALNWAGVKTDAHVIVGGGAKTTDNETVNRAMRLRATATADEDTDTYVDAVVAYSEDGTALNRATLTDLSDSREFMEVAPIMNCVMFAGGQDEKGYSRVVEMYDSFGGHRILTPLSSARTDMASAALGENILFAGGDDGSGASDVIECYTINFTKRMIGLSLPLAVKGLCGCSFGNYAVFAGGRDENGLPTDKVIAVDRNMNIISNIEPLSSPRYNLAAAVCTNPDDETESYLLIAGGKSTHSGFSTVVDVYDSSLNKVNAGLELTVGRSRLKGASCQGYALFAGGVVGVEPADTPSNIVDVFNYKLKRFEPMTLSEARNSLSAASFSDKVLFAGGYSLNGVSKVVDTFTFNSGGDDPEPEYATVTYHWPSALVQYFYGNEN